MNSFDVRAIGRVESSLASIESAPRQADEGAPAACLVFSADVQDALLGIQPGDEILVVTWLDRARRDAVDGTPILDVKPALAAEITAR